MKEDDCDGAYPCSCYRNTTKCQLAGFEKVVELKNAGLTIYRHSSKLGDENIQTARKEDEENIFIFHNTKDDDIQSADFLPEIEKRAITCPRCRRILDHALNILQKVTAICKNEVIGICDHCKLKQKPCRECVGAIKKFFDIKKEEKRNIKSKKRLGEYLSKVQNEFKGYFGDEKRGRTEILKDHVEDDTKLKLRAKSDEHIDQLCRWKYVRHGRDLNIKPLYRESEWRDLIKPKADTDKAKKHIAFKEGKQIIYEPSTSMFSIERLAKSTFLLHGEGHSQDEETVEKKSGLLSPEKDQQYVLDTGKQMKIYDDTRADKHIIESEQKKLDKVDVLKEKDYFKVVETQSDNIKKDFVFSFPRDKNKIHEDKRQISSTELIQNVHDKIREKTEEKKRKEEEMRRRKLDEKEKKLAALREKEMEDREKARRDQIGEMRTHQPDGRGYGKSQIKANGAKKSKSAPEIRESTKGTVSESTLKSKSAISKGSKPDEVRDEVKDAEGLKPYHKQSKAEAEAESKHPKGESKDEPKTMKGKSKKPKDDSKTVLKQVKGESKQAIDDSKQSKDELKPPKVEPKKDAKEPKTESKRDSKHLKTESKQPKVDTKEDSKGTIIEPKLDSKQPKPPKPPKAEASGEVQPKQIKVDSKEDSKGTKIEPKFDSKQPKPPMPPKAEASGEVQPKQIKVDSKEDSKGTKIEPKLDSKQPKPPKPPKAEVSGGVQPKQIKVDSKEDSKGTKIEPKLDSKQPKPPKPPIAEASGELQPKPPKPPKAEASGEVKQTKKESKETKASKGESKHMKAEPQPPKKTDDSKEPKIDSKGVKSEKEAKRDTKKIKEREPKLDTKEPEDAIIEKEVAEKPKAEKPPPPNIEEEPMIKYGKDIKLRSPDEPRVPRRQIEAPPPPPPKKKFKKDLKVKQIKMLNPSQNLLSLQMVKVKGGTAKLRTLSQLMTQSEIFKHLDGHKTLKGERCPMCINSTLELEYESRRRQKAEMQEIIDGRKIKYVSGFDKHEDKDAVNPLLYKLKYNDQFKAEIIQAANETPVMVRQFDTTQKQVKIMPEAESKGVIKYALSDRSFIEKGWTRLPTEKVVRKMNVYRMRPAHPEFDWFKRNKSKRLMTYDTGERLAEFDDDGRGRWYYKNQRMALQYYDAEELNAQQRFVIFSNGEPDERGRARPYTILATFDYLGNGVVFDHGGKIRLKYNQTEGVVLDRSIGPASHWKWHTLNDPPVLQQVMIDTQMTHKDPEILKMGAPNENLPRPDNEDMLAIEFDNFIKEKSQKLKQTFKPFQIKMKAMKINEHFSLKVLDQANVYLIYRDGTTNIKLNLGMLLDHKEIVDTDTAEVGEVSNNIERFPAKTDSLNAMQKSVAYARHFERSRTERERRLRPPEPSASADKLTAAASKPLKPPLCAAYSSASCTTITSKPLPKAKSRKPSSTNVYYDSRLL